MKTLLALTMFAVSISASAFEQKAVLDFSKLYGNTDAGVYEMTVVLTSKTTVSESTLTFNTHQDDGWFTCTTSANFEVGNMDLTLKNLRNGDVKKVSHKINAVITHTVDGTECDTSIDNFRGTQVLYSQIAPKNAIALNVQAPAGFNNVGVWLSPFNGYLNVEAEVAVLGNKLVINPAGLFAEGSIYPRNNQNSSVTYYVFAQSGSSSLSLGTGLIEFNR